MRKVESRIYRSMKVGADMSRWMPPFHTLSAQSTVHNRDRSIAVQGISKVIQVG